MAGASELDKAVEKLTKREKGWKAFTQAPAVGARPGAVSVGRPSAASGGTSASFAERDYLLREYWPEAATDSSDGIFTILWKPIKTIMGEGNSTLQFKEPTTPPAP